MKIHWIKWDELPKSKMVGGWGVGVGFRDLTMFSDSLLAKQAWRFLHNKNSLLYKFFKALFSPNCSIMEAKDSRSGSYAWHSLLKGKEINKRGAQW